MQPSKIFFLLFFILYKNVGNSQETSDNNPIITLLSSEKWKVDRRRLNNTDQQKDSLYTFKNHLKVVDHNLISVTKGNRVIPYTWTQLKTADIRISIIFKPDSPAITFQYKYEDSNANVIVFEQLKDRGIPERFCFRLILRK